VGKGSICAIATPIFTKRICGILPDLSQIRASLAYEEAR